MTTHPAKAHLSRLVEEEAEGKHLVIAQADRPIVKVEPIDTVAPGIRRRIGLLAGLVAVPDDFDNIGRSEIEALFAD